jgi:hypothetical protein
MQTARPIARSRLDWHGKRKLALFSLITSIPVIAMLLGKAGKAVTVGTFRVPFAGWSLHQPLGLYAVAAVLLLFAALGAYVAYRDWKFLRLTSLRLRRNR